MPVYSTSARAAKSTRRPFLPFDLPNELGWTLIIGSTDGHCFAFVDLLWTSSRRFASRPDADQWTAKQIGPFVVAAKLTTRSPGLEIEEFTHESMSRRIDRQMMHRRPGE